MTGRLIHAADLFCGGGGTSTGLVRAVERMGFRLDLVAVNHWPRAVETHAANHPTARHFCARIDQVQLKEVFPGGKLDLLVASPECIYHSIARGGKPVDDQRRESAWGILRWIDELRPRSVIIENVPEFRGWGPLGADNKPLKSKKGQVFAAWVGAIRSLGYQVDWRILNAADYGDPTTRRRLFVQARRGRSAPVWPIATHAKEPGGLFPAVPWRAAREIIDWGLPGKSIFWRKKPLAETTMARIAEGLRRFGGPQAAPFLVAFNAGKGKKPRVHSVDAPLPTITTEPRFGVAQPLLVGCGGPARAGKPASVEEPIGTVLAKNHRAIVQPFVVKTAHKGGNGAYVRSTEDPLYTVTTAPGEVGVAQPFLVHTTHGGRIHDVEKPLPTVTCARRGEIAVVEPFLLSQDGRGAPRAVSSPAPTIVTDGAVSLIEPFVLPYYRTGTPTSVAAPLPTVTTKDRFGLVETVQLDILFRMLRRHELAAAMGFPKGYVFTGNSEDQVRQIGNAVCVSVADALCGAALGEVA